MNNQDYKQLLMDRTYRFSLQTMQLIDKLPQSNFSMQIISRQLIRSATSIGANIVEAQASSSKKDFTNFMSHALKSANETKYWFSLLHDSGKAPVADTKNLLAEATELSNILGSSLLKLRGKK